MMKSLVASALATVALVSAPLDADAQNKKPRRDREVARDCTPYNGPFGYYGNPWCDGGYKFAEDYPPGTGGYFDILEMPQVQRLRRRLE